MRAGTDAYAKSAFACAGFADQDMALLLRLLYIFFIFVRRRFSPACSLVVKFIHLEAIP
jgi:hypothetical protein